MVTTMAKARDGIQSTGNISKKAAPIKVKQEMIDFIKTQGMTRALKRAGSISAKGTKGEAEFLEGVRRMYGANRLSAATKAATPAKFTAPTGSNKKPAGRMTKSAAPAKKSSGMSTGAKVTGGVLATAALVASRGKAAGLASKLSPGLAKSSVGKALGIGAKANTNSAANVMKKTIAEKSGSVTVGPKGSFGKSTAAMAKAGKNVGTKSEYAQKAMQDKARAYLASRAATKAAPAAKPAAKAPVKKTATKKKMVGMSGVGAVSLKGDTRKTKKK